MYRKYTSWKSFEGHIAASPTLLEWAHDTDEEKITEEEHTVMYIITDLSLLVIRRDLLSTLYPFVRGDWNEVCTRMVVKKTTQS